MNFKRKEQRSGQSLAEFALTLPLVLLLVFGFLDLGRAVYYYSAIGNAAREGARYASVRKLDLQSNVDDQNEVKAVIQDYAVSLALDASKITFPVPAQDYVTVAVEYDFAPVTPFINTLTLQSESTMLLAPIARQ
jgi:Flp pilus assembly protein TadG